MLVSVKPYPSCVSYRVKGESLPNITKIRIELLKKSVSKMKGDRIEKEITAVLDVSYKTQKLDIIMYCKYIVAM